LREQEPLLPRSLDQRHLIRSREMTRSSMMTSVLNGERYKPRAAAWHATCATVFAQVYSCLEMNPSSLSMLIDVQPIRSPTSRGVHATTGQNSLELGVRRHSPSRGLRFSAAREPVSRYIGRHGAWDSLESGEHRRGGEFCPELDRPACCG
jgi:hypothetical protein